MSLLLFCFITAHAEMTAAPGDYSLRMKAGPAFNLQDYENQFRVGAEFDYELGYNLGITFLGLFGISDETRFQIIPSMRYDFLYVGPASFHGLAGLGYGRLNQGNSLDLRLGTGVVLPLGDYYEFTSDFNYFMSTLGNEGIPMSFEWLLGFGFRFR